MIGASKILTVSYGTFSCTLEGFDEPFNTMKAIAEYFRDLAAEDRYFGAEPPTPDAAMLHRIAEREIQRRVEAKIQDNGVILRAGDAEAPALAAPVVAPSVAAAPAVEADGESVAARLSRLRAAQTAAPLAAVAAEPTIHHIAEAAALADDAYSEDQHSDDILAGIAALAAPEAVAPQVQHDTALQDLIARDTAVDQQDTSAAEIDAQDLADLTALDAVAQAPVAEAAAQDLGFAPDLGFEEDPDAQDAPAADLAAAFADDLPAPAEPFTAESLIASEDPVIEDFVASAETATAEDYDDEILADLLPEHDPIAEAAAYADEDMLASLGALIAENDQIQPEAVVAQPAAPQVIEAYDEDDAEDDLLLSAIATKLTVTPAPEPAAMDSAALAPQPGEKIQRARARVIKIRRADAPRPDVAVPAQHSLLSPEAEAALQAELAALEAETPVEISAPVRPTRPVRHLTQHGAAVATDLEDDAILAAALADPQADAELPEAPAEAQPSAQAEGRKLLETESDDDAVERLMAATNSAMDDEESRRRHSAISHLKAAVAATEAERQINAGHPGKTQPDRQDIYRHDLESVVRAKPVDGTIEARAAANAERLTPLVLVSEQRIDRAKTPAAPLMLTPVATPAPIASSAAPRVVMPVRPRRVSGAASMAAMQAMPHDNHLLDDVADDLDDEDLLTAEEEGNFFAEGQNFADFAEKLGANSLADLLEASAVYCTHVLGRPQFSRPLVMRQLETLIDEPDHPREDRLRAFGTLLRQGRIAKIKRGQFAMTAHSPLMAEALRITA
ncbi:hypothetical protein [Cypionkella sp.]|uniref:hypothetical protein n=1 Tax=Cypionkella sp. TaxID=2811411 RepID=UPI002ABBC98C|nr:hypothetical protein [Cypionkella sp.]MDZ4393232.1 hypothetical protein [Cypionkella sp.]